MACFAAHHPHSLSRPIFLFLLLLVLFCVPSRLLLNTAYILIGCCCSLINQYYVVELFDCLTAWLSLSRYVYKRKKCAGIYISGDLQLAGSPRPNQNGRNKEKKLILAIFTRCIYIYIPCAAAAAVRACVMWRTISFTMTSFFSLLLI